MVFGKKQNKKTNDDKTKRNKKEKKKERERSTWSEGAKEIITKFGTENLYTNLQSERCDCAIKKEGL